jgi:uncharacterized protein (UPF0276 family)
MQLTAGLGLQPAHFDAARVCAAHGLWFEVHPENYPAEGGPRARVLESIRARFPLSPHGVGLALGGATPPDPAHLTGVVRLAQRLAPALISEHLAWSRLGDRYFPDLLPVPRTRAAVDSIAANIARVQDALGRPFALKKNSSHNLALPELAMGELEFFAALIARTDCGMLLDVNHVWVSACNLGYEAAAYLDAVPGDWVLEIHLAGHAPDPELGAALLIDSHDRAVSAEVWALHARLVAHIGPRPTLIERDESLPDFDGLLAERERAAEQLAHAAVATGSAA